MSFRENQGENKPSQRQTHECGPYQRAARFTAESPARQAYLATKFVSRPGRVQCARPSIAHAPHVAPPASTAASRTRETPAQPQMLLIDPILTVCTHIAGKSLAMPSKILNCVPDLVNRLWSQVDASLLHDL
jgi:hypothetical protein